MTRPNHPSDSEIFALVGAERPDSSARERTLAAVLEHNRRWCAGEAIDEPELTLPQASSGGGRGRTLLLVAAAAALVLGAGYAWSRRSAPREITALAEPPGGFHRSPPAAGASSCVPTRCQPVSPGDALIADFDDVSPEGVFVDNDAFSRRERDSWQRFYGSTWVVPASPGGLHQDTRRGDWRVDGVVRRWSGFGIWFGPCMVDLSRYRGVSFEIWGDTGPEGALVVTVESDPDSVPERCRPNVGSCDEKIHRCISPSAKISVPTAKDGAVTLLWGDFAGGVPETEPDPARIIQLRWDFVAPVAPSAAYPVDVHVDDVRLVR